MATVKILIEADGTEIDITESSRVRSMSAHDLEAVPGLLGVAVKRAIHAVAAGGESDRWRATTAVAERMGVNVNYVES